MVEELAYVCQILNKHDVRYLIVGGAATNLHGYIRLSRNSKNEETDRPDIDVWFRPNYNNYLVNLCDSLEEFGLDTTAYKKSSTNIRSIFISKSFENFDLDFLPELKDFPNNFRECYKNRFVAQIRGVEIPLLSLVDLIKSKESSNRIKDIKDVEELRKFL